MGNERMRQIDVPLKDIVSAQVRGTPVYHAVSEAKIAEFCKPCDFAKEGEVCRIVGYNDQARYAARGWCGWSMVNGVRGNMTEGGFEGEGQAPATK